MDNNFDLNTNNIDFQKEIAQNSDNCKYDASASAEGNLAQNLENIDCVADDTSSSVDIENDLMDNEDCEEQPTQNDNLKMQNTTDNEEDNTENELSPQDKNCLLDQVKYDKMKNWFFGSIPFILVAIVISLFNIGRIRQPLSFLFLALGLAELAITSFIISKKIAKTCTCKNCTHQTKSAFKYAIIFGVGALGFLGLFIYFMVK